MVLQGALQDWRCSSVHCCAKEVDEVIGQASELG